MSKPDFDAKLTAIEAISKAEAGRPNMPVSIALQEADDLFEWCQSDKDKLVKAGLEWEFVDDLPQRVGACRYAESQWQKEFKSIKDAQKEWRVKSPKAYNLRNELVHHFFHAYRKSPDLVNIVQRIAQGTGNADMIQDLSDLAALGKDNPEPLQKIGFEIELLDEADLLSGQLATLLAKVNNDSLENNTNLKLLRDKAFTYMKQAVDEIRHHGKFVFWRNNERKKGYTSDYIRRKKSKAKNKKAGKGKNPRLDK